MSTPLVEVFDLAKIFDVSLGGLVAISNAEELSPDWWGALSDGTTVQCGTVINTAGTGATALARTAQAAGVTSFSDAQGNTWGMCVTHRHTRSHILLTSQVPPGAQGVQ